jgi:hypothetical protein
LSTPYNPLDKIHLGESVRDALLRQPVYPLPPPQQFVGAGIYAIYYVGDFPAYQAIAAANAKKAFRLPIYVGEAVPEGARKGGLIEPVRPTHKLFSRLREHSHSIEAATNLHLGDFFCRYLVVDDIWIPLGETLLITTFSPVWNKVVDGFGIHTPGGGRGKQMTSAWDTLHPGRGFVKRLGLPPHTKTQKQLIAEIQRYLELPREKQQEKPVVDTGADA